MISHEITATIYVPVLRGRKTSSIILEGSTKLVAGIRYHFTRCPGSQSGRPFKPLGEGFIVGVPSAADGGDESGSFSVCLFHRATKNMTFPAPRDIPSAG